MKFNRDACKALVRLTPMPTGGYAIDFENGVSMGVILADVDGYYKWWQDAYNGGYLDEPVLLAVAYHLEELNEEWDKQINEYFSSRHGEHDMEHGQSLRPEEL